MRKKTCTRKHRMIEIVTDLWLCECSSDGRKSGLKGAEDEARRLVYIAGGLDLLRDRIERAEQNAARLRGGTLPTGHSAPGRARAIQPGRYAGASPTWEATEADSLPDDD